MSGMTGQPYSEIFRVLKPGGRLVLFCPNRGYPFETHGIYWRGKYHFGNIPLVNYLPQASARPAGTACQGLQH